MKDLFSAFSSDFFWPLATLLLPGALALTPSAVAVIWLVEPVCNFAQSNHAETGIIYGTLITFCGLVLENIGARLELLFFNKLGTTAWDDWYSYLKTEKTPRLIAHKYIHTLVLRLKFDQGCFAAVPFALIGLWFWPVNCRSLVIATIALALFWAYSIYEAYDTVKTLAEIRAKIFR